jgi:hypothetical protein
VISDRHRHIFVVGIARHGVIGTGYPSTQGLYCFTTDDMIHGNIE